MSRLVVVIPNSLNEAFCAIDDFAATGAIRSRDDSVLKTLYAKGWHDGFVAEPAARLASDAGLSVGQFLALIDAPARVHVVHPRVGHSEEFIVEQLSLSRPWDSGDMRLGWWQYCLVGRLTEPHDVDEVD